MCVCTPEIRTPYCGNPGCEWPAQKRVNLELSPTQCRTALKVLVAYQEIAKQTGGREISSAIILNTFQEISRAMIDQGFDPE